MFLEFYITYLIFHRRTPLFLVDTDSDNGDDDDKEDRSDDADGDGSLEGERTEVGTVPTVIVAGTPQVVVDTAAIVALALVPLTGAWREKTRVTMSKASDVTPFYDPFV